MPWSVVVEAAQRWEQLGAMGAPVRVVRMPDQLGPLDKAWGCVHYAAHADMPADGVLIVSDDDYKRGPGWVAKLSSRSLLRHPADRRLVSFELPPHAATSLRVRGSNGYAALVDSFGSAPPERGSKTVHAHSLTASLPVAHILCLPSRWRGHRRVGHV